MRSWFWMHLYALHTPYMHPILFFRSAHMSVSKDPRQTINRKQTKAIFLLKKWKKRFRVVFLEFLSKCISSNCKCMGALHSFVFCCIDRFCYCACLLLLFRPFFFAFRFLVNDRWTLCWERNICVCEVWLTRVKRR